MKRTVSLKGLLLRIPLYLYIVICNFQLFRLLSSISGILSVLGLRCDLSLIYTFQYDGVEGFGGFLQGSKVFNQNLVNNLKAREVIFEHGNSQGA